jgi:PTH1 family peptidyl-tRNA hydrolase
MLPLYQKQDSLAQKSRREREGSVMKWIVGLGNPGPQYAKTKHNVGFMALDELAARHGIALNQSKCKSVIGEGVIGGVKTVLIKPMTFMNLSGEAVRAYMDYYKVQLEDMIVVYDDLDTELGKVRLRYQGSAGGHNGIKSIIQHTGTQSFNRVRMGISRPEPGYAIVDYVLSTFAKKDGDKLQSMITDTCDALEFSLKNTFEQTMAKFNG